MLNFLKPAQKHVLLIGISVNYERLPVSKVVLQLSSEIINEVNIKYC